VTGGHHLGRDVGLDGQRLRDLQPSIGCTLARKAANCSTSRLLPLLPQIRFLF
jgi:hypothetical protein